MKAKLGRWPHYHSVFGWPQQFKSDCDLQKTPYTLERVVDFPVDPRLLPVDVFKAAYETDDQPISKDIQHFLELGQHIPLRKNSVLLVKEKQQEDQFAMSAANPLQPSQLQQLHAFARMQGMVLQPANEEAIPGLHLFDSAFYA